MSISDQEQKWRDTYKEGGAYDTCMYPSWLLHGCPVCGHSYWTVTNDYWAYCGHCMKGFPTDYPFTLRPLAHLDQNGVHCFMCEGTGKDYIGGKCTHCDGVVTQPEVK